ncbi:MAG: glycosyltransferase [Coleofasciculus sp. A1-SPW-01]|uniref:glycosyltransferase n=1 Tax=Coleofasciculus sp. A1-SPW-01 TaxID=3070819 RepID=UPI0033009E7A
MLRKKRQPTSSTKPKTKGLISPWAWAIFIAGIVLFFGTVFSGNWTSNSPTFFSPEQLRPDVRPSLLSTSPSSRGIIPSIPSDETQKSNSLVAPLHPFPNRSLPEFIQPPGQPWNLLFPTIVVAYICLLLRFIPSNNWTRLIVKGILLILMTRYFIWRTIATLNFDHLATATFSLLIYFIESLGILSFILHIPQSVWSNAKQRSAQADRYSQDILSGKYQPSVDVFVPTYNEPESVVSRTVIGCQAMDYANKKVYILDDTRRPNIRALAKELGCEYITRPDNQHAKAGNLNSALPKTQGELIAIMDADFVPFKNFLTRTVGFFLQPKIALVQTPQAFYNPDHHARNLGVDHILYDDLANFFGFSLSCRDVTNSVLCCGTSYVVRRMALEEVGGYNTICLAEDSPTSTTMLTLGWRLIYLNEVLSMGESTRTYVDFLKQRTRWHHSNYQIFCCGDKIPIWSTMNWLQKSYFFTFFLGTFDPLFRTVFMFTPLMSLILGISPIVSTTPEMIYYFLPWILLMAGSTGWATEYCGSFFWNEVYQTILCFPTLKCLIFAIRDPFGLAFKVTRKGVKAETKNYNLNQTWPLLVGVILMIAVLCLHLVGYHWGVWQTAASSEFAMIFLLLIYNIIIMSIAFLAAIDQPECRGMDRFPLRTGCTLRVGDFSNPNHSISRVYEGYTVDLSEGGARIILITDNVVIENEPISLELPDYHFSVTANLRGYTVNRNNTEVTLKFVNVTTQKNRQLVEILYTDMTWWKRSKRPGNLDVLIAMLASLLTLRPLRSKYN